MITRGVGWDEDKTMLFVPRWVIRVGLTKNQQEVGQVAIGDKHFAAVDDIGIFFFTAAVTAWVTSHPASGSVIAVPMMTSPVTRRGSHVCFCSSLP